MVYLLFALPGLLLALWATFKVKTTFAQYSEVGASSGMTGADAARRLLDQSNIHDVQIEQTDGFLGDHYDPTSKTLRLSADVYDSSSLSAIGVACHEAGHAIQHAQAYGPLALRSGLVPMTQISSYLSYFVIIAGFLMRSPGLILIGSIVFSVTVLFALITLPVEWDASARAKKLMVTAGIVNQQEAGDAAKVLNAAFMTYVASAVTALLTLVYYLIQSGIFGGRRDD